MSKPLPLVASEVWKIFDGVTAVGGVSLELGESHGRTISPDEWASRQTGSHPVLES